MPLRELAEPSWYSANNEISTAIEKRQALYEDEFLAETEHGRKILELRREKENLLDTVWIATSPKQIKELWQQVDLLLGSELTTLQREALAIDPIESQ